MGCVYIYICCIYSYTHTHIYIYIHVYRGVYKVSRGLGFMSVGQGGLRGTDLWGYILTPKPLNSKP